MNETITSILERRSTRGFKPEQIKDAELQTIIDCGLCAPSAMNTQGWHFTVIQNAHLIDWMNTEIKKVMPEAMRERMLARSNGSEDFSIFYSAPTVILVSGKDSDHYTGVNCGIATENICVAAHSLGVASCIIGLAAFLFNSDKADEYKQELNIPDDYRVIHAIALGYPAIKMTKPERLDGRVHYIK